MSDTNPLPTPLAYILRAFGLPLPCPAQSAPAEIADPIQQLHQSLEREYEEAYPAAGSELVAAWVHGAILRAKDDFPGFNAHARAIADLAEALRPFRPGIPPLDYLGVLFIGVTESGSENQSTNSTKEKKTWVV